MALYFDIAQLIAVVPMKPEPPVIQNLISLIFFYINTAEKSKGFISTFFPTVSL